MRNSKYAICSMVLSAVYVHVGRGVTFVGKEWKEARQELCGASVGRASLAKGGAHAKALGQEFTWGVHVTGTE